MLLRALTYVSKGSAPAEPHVTINLPAGKVLGGDSPAAMEVNCDSSCSRRGKQPGPVFVFLFFSFRFQTFRTG